jgi:hypothetical protein
MPPDSLDSLISMQARDQMGQNGSWSLDLRTLCVTTKPARNPNVRRPVTWWISRGGGGSQPPRVAVCAGHPGDCEREYPKNGLICAANSYYLACGDHTFIRKKIHKQAAPPCGDLCAKTEGTK